MLPTRTRSTIGRPRRRSAWTAAGTTAPTTPRGRRSGKRSRDDRDRAYRGRPRYARAGLRLLRRQASAAASRAVDPADVLADRRVLRRHRVPVGVGVLGTQL